MIDAMTIMGIVLALLATLLFGVLALVGFAVGVVFALRGIFRSLTEDWKARS
jgi:hypothetical protein|tara:strand:+ start:2231 stop:2386 length:156 start_codon:yes stop_codon:yes gene_type:complete